jgi:hypothetical protein
MVHGDGKASISFLQNYLESLKTAITKHVNLKGKTAILKSQPLPNTPNSGSRCRATAIGWTKMNVDGDGTHGA